MMTKRVVFVASLLGVAWASDQARADDCAIDVSPDPLQLQSLGPFLAADLQRATAVDVDDDNCVTYVREGVSIAPLTFARLDPVLGRSVDLLAFDDGSINPCGPTTPCVVGGVVLYGAAPFDKLANPPVLRESEVVLFILP